jgi:hypothetical protein
MHEFDNRVEQIGVGICALKRSDGGRLFGIKVVSRLDSTDNTLYATETVRRCCPVLTILSMTARYSMIEVLRIAPLTRGGSVAIIYWVILSLERSYGSCS